jgi:hypothetical protein
MCLAREPLNHLDHSLLARSQSTSSNCPMPSSTPEVGSVDASGGSAENGVLPPSPRSNCGPTSISQIETAIRLNREYGMAFGHKAFLPVRPKISVRVNVRKGSTPGFWSLVEIARTDNVIHCPTVLIDVEDAQNIKQRMQT